ncbi:MAG: bifunctional diaminohydroxyphosphoribosylaminopyrimidine deaminase/5-amino-6-(5-phosphoribosylamino)uracil reductase RibD [Smithellaceae bacterium]|nr:bifunctional diaminohydroxyphosphoribosylaminopyrimidine deaminase/5-amino-6-(5-phosphoribosylamino)uracil reductase RibD [Smithellaceae bacterium]
MNDEEYMKLAIKLAAKGRCYASPNPMVGAVIVKNGQIIGRGYHQCCGQNHAEVNAIADAKGKVAGSTLYVTLEPCCHSGKTPPCTDLIIRHKIRRVVIAAADSNPLVSCRGIACLENAEIKVTRGVLEAESRSLNEVFFHFMETGLPFITVKYAQTLDGRIATATGKSQWISSPASLKYAHRLRAEHDAILVGIGTVLRDNPTLTVRLVRGRNPLRVIVDSNLATPADANVMRNLSETPTLIATTQKPSDPRYRKLSEAGARLMTVAPDREKHVDLKKLFQKLARENTSSVLIEGGAAVITSALGQGLVNRLVVVTAPKILGKGIEAVGDLNIRELTDAKILSVRVLSKKGPDVIMDARL